MSCYVFLSSFFSTFPIITDTFPVVCFHLMYQSGTPAFINFTEMTSIFMRHILTIVVNELFPTTADPSIKLLRRSRLSISCQRTRLLCTENRSAYRYRVHITDFSAVCDLWTPARSSDMHPARLIVPQWTEHWSQYRHKEALNRQPLHQHCGFSNTHNTSPFNFCKGLFMAKQQNPEELRCENIFHY